MKPVNLTLDEGRMLFELLNAAINRWDSQSSSAFTTLDRCAFKISRHIASTVAVKIERAMKGKE